MALTVMGRVVSKIDANTLKFQVCLKKFDAFVLFSKEKALE
jgi:hypothetical protein